MSIRLFHYCTLLLKFLPVHPLSTAMGRMFEFMCSVWILMKQSYIQSLAYPYLFLSPSSPSFSTSHHPFFSCQHNTWFIVQQCTYLFCSTLRQHKKNHLSQSLYSDTVVCKNNWQGPTILYLSCSLCFLSACTPGCSWFGSFCNSWGFGCRKHLNALLLHSASVTLQRLGFRRELQDKDSGVITWFQIIT